MRAVTLGLRIRFLLQLLSPACIKDRVVFPALKRPRDEAPPPPRCHQQDVVGVVGVKQRGSASSPEGGGEPVLRQRAEEMYGTTFTPWERSDRKSFIQGKME